MTIVLFTGSAPLPSTTTTVTCPIAFGPWAVTEETESAQGGVSFDGITLYIKSENPPELDWNIRLTETELHDGRISIQSSTYTAFKVVCECLTNDYQDIRDLRDRVGIPLTLLYNGVIRENTYISRFDSYKQIKSGLYQFTIGFSQDTAT